MAYTARIYLPAFLVRGVSTASSLPVYDGGEVVRPTSGTYTLTSDGGEVVVDAAAVTVGGDGIATYSSTVAGTYSYSFAWRETWRLTIGGVVHIFARSAYVVREVPVCPLDVPTLEGYHPLVEEIDRSRPGSAQAAIDRAWGMLWRALIRRGVRPAQLLDVWQLLDWLVRLTLWTLFEGAGDPYREYVGDQYKLAMDLEAATQLNLDHNDDGQLSTTEENRAAVPMLILGGAPGSRRLWGYHHG